jgi:hypothetical protein
VKDNLARSSLTGAIRHAPSNQRDLSESDRRMIMTNVLRRKPVSGYHHRKETGPIAAISANEFKRRYSISNATFYRQIAAGRLKARKLGTKTLIFAADEAAWRNSLPALKSAA